MKINNYTYVKGFCIPNYWYVEGDEKEEYWVDDNNLYYNKFNDNYDSNEGGEKKDERKWWIIAPCMPTNTPLTEETKHLLKWLVAESYHPEEDYAFYEWDFDKHCIKE